MIKEKNYELLPINKDRDTFFSINQDKDETKIQGLINKYIVFELLDKENNTIQTLPGKLIEYKNNSILIRQYDDGTDETRKLWTDYDGSDLFKDFEETISLENIRGIEEYKKYNQSLELKDEYRNCICKITNKNNVTILVMIRDFNGFELEFDYKYEDAEGTHIVTSSYPLCFITKIEKL